MEQEQGANIPPVKISKDKFSDRVVVVTGAASGIGKTTALLFASQGASVVAVDVNEDGLVRVVDEMRNADSAGAIFSHRVCDLTDEAQVSEMIEWVISATGRIDVLAHLAGIYPFHPLLNFPTEMYRKIMTVNVDTSFFLVRAILPRMQSRGYGRIVLTSSGTVQEPEEGLSVYVASKAAVVGLTRAAAVEAGPGVTVNTVMPGLVKTPTIWGAGVRADGTHPIFEHVIGKQVVKRAGLPEDIAHAVCFLASPEASFITGQILDVSGGNTFH